MMEPTRRFWGSCVLGGFLLLVGAVVHAELIIGGGLLVFGWLLAHQLAVTLQMQDTLATTTVEMTATPGRVRESQSLRVQAAVDVPVDPGPLRAVTLPAPPETTDARDTTVSVDGDERSDDRRVVADLVCSLPVAGQYELPRATLRFEDDYGLFTAEVARGAVETVTVDPNAPTDASIGQGGERYSVGLGEHDPQRASGGVEPGDLREYTPGDPQSRIDWKTTARLGDPYVREFEAETDRDTVFVLDHSATTGTGSEGRTVLDYLQEVTLWLLDRAAALDDSTGLLTVDENGVTDRYALGTGANHYRQLRTRVLDTDTSGSDRHSASRLQTQLGNHTTTEAEAIDSETAFAETLRPFVADTQTYVERVADDPLFAALQHRLQQLTGDPWVVVLTDDTNRQELIETAKLAGRRAGHVTLCIAPRTLFESDALSTLDTTYEEYVEFEEFRRTLGGRSGVTAYEVGPETTIERIITQHRTTEQTDQSPSSTV